MVVPFDGDAGDSTSATTMEGRKRRTTWRKKDRRRRREEEEDMADCVGMTGRGIIAWGREGDCNISQKKRETGRVFDPTRY